MATPFKGTIKLDVRDSTPDWDPFIPPKAAGGRAERPDRPLRRHGSGGLVAVRRSDQHAHPPEARRQRADVQPVAHDRPVLADALDVPDRSQPPPERHGVHHRGLDRLPGRERPYPARVRDDGRGHAPGRLEHLLAGQEPQRAGRRPGRRAGPRRRGRSTRAGTASTASSAARPTTGIRISSTTTTTSTSPIRRRRATTSRRTWPIRPSR